jgi:hypothetical protein
MTNLSPAAQSVWNAFKDAPICAEVKLAAALRAVADQCKIEWNYHPDYPETESVIVVSDLLALAAELIGTTTRSEND